ncbi:DinB family protein [Streptomyces sp. NPDC056697]|uniref:DinB family protein n=1 Tax=Streptomyces sp. NPDC056697 TaxID=3345915 RepID=UPI00367FE259
MNEQFITPIEIPDATTEPAAYVQALLDTLGEHDPFEIYQTTAAKVRALCQDLTEAQWMTPMAPGEWCAQQIVGHIFDVDVVYGFRWRLILTEDRPSYPGYNEKLWSELPRPETAELLDALTGLRAANTALLRGVPGEEWQRWGVHGEQGPEQFDLLLPKVAGHDLAHLNQLERTVAVARAADGLSAWA